MRLIPVLAAIGCLYAPASAMSVRVPVLPAKFVGAHHAAAWRAWEAPLVGAYAAARGEKLTLSPQLEAFVPVIGAAKKDGGPVAVAPRSAALYLLTVQLQEAGLNPETFAALPAFERVQRMQAAYDALRGELRSHGEALVAAAAAAESAEDRAALQAAQSRLSLLVTAHADYIDPQLLPELRSARDKAFAAHAKLTGAAVEGAARSGRTALGGASAEKRTGFSALGGKPDPWRGEEADPHAAARGALLAPLSGGRVPAEFIAQFARYQQMGDQALSFDALRAFKPIAADPFATGENPARALAGIGLIAREAPAQRARDLAVQALSSTRYLAPELESLRIFTLRDVGVATDDKELMARILKSLTADAGAKREGPAGEALSVVEEAWKTRFGVPVPAKADKMRANGAKFIKQGLMGLIGGGVSMYFFGAANWLGSWGVWLAYVGLGIGAATLLLGLYFKLRAGRS